MWTVSLVYTRILTAAEIVAQEMKIARKPDPSVDGVPLTSFLMKRKGRIHGSRAPSGKKAGSKSDGDHGYRDGDERQWIERADFEEEASE